MDAFLRAIAVILEIIVIGAIFFCILYGVKMVLLEIGMKEKYSKIINVALVAVGGLLLTFLASHLATFYPTI